VTIYALPANNLNMNTTYLKADHKCITLDPSSLASQAEAYHEVNGERLKFQSCPKDLIESLDEPSGPNCRDPGFPTSDPNAKSRADTSMVMPGISDGVKGAWLLEAADEGLTAISDDIALPVAPACGASGTPLSTTMLQQHKSTP